MIEAMMRISEGFMFQLLLAEFLFFSGSKKRVGFKWKMPVFCTAMILGYDFINVLSPLSEGFFIVRLSLCLVYVLTLLGFWWCYDCEINVILFCGVGAYATQNLAYNLQKVLRFYLGIKVDSILSTMLILGGLVLVYAIVYQLFVKKQKKFKLNEISQLRNLVSAIFILLLTTFFPVLFIESSESGNVLYLLYVMVGDILVLLIQFDLLKEGRLQRQNERMEQILLAGQRQYQMSKDNIELINMKCHDLKHQIKALRGMTNDELKNEAIKEIEQAVLVYDSSIKTGNDTLDVILMEKSLYCEKNNIKLTCIAN